MKREIKFRLWDKKKKSFTERAWPKMAINSDGTFGFPEDDLYVAMQFTNLKDKNKKEIYEGDLLEANVGHGKFIAEVHLSVKQGWYPFMFQGEEKSEIIGNIYENPELLEESR